MKETFKSWISKVIFQDNVRWKDLTMLESLCSKEMSRYFQENVALDTFRFIIYDIVQNIIYILDTIKFDVYIWLYWQYIIYYFIVITAFEFSKLNCYYLSFTKIVFCVLILLYEWMCQVFCEVKIMWMSLLFSGRDLPGKGNGDSKGNRKEGQIKWRLCEKFIKIILFHDHFNFSNLQINYIYVKSKPMLGLINLGNFLGLATQGT